MSQPNEWLITSDREHHDTLSVTNLRIQTPAPDRLCNEGTGQWTNLCNRAAHAAIKSALLHRFMPSELMREPTRMPRICGA